MGVDVPNKKLFCALVLKLKESVTTLFLVIAVFIDHNCTDRAFYLFFA